MGSGRSIKVSSPDINVSILGACDRPPSAGFHRRKLGHSATPAHLTVLMSLPLHGRDQVVNSEIPVNQRHREFWAKSPARGCDWGSCFRTPELNREPETSGEFAVESEIPRKTGIQRKTPRGTLSAFSVNSDASDSSLTEFSSPDRTRTYDKAINSRLLYQLSYRGILCTRRIRPVWRKYDYCRGRKLASKARRCKSILGVFLFVIASRI